MNQRKLTKGVKPLSVNPRVLQQQMDEFSPPNVKMKPDYIWLIFRYITIQTIKKRLIDDHADDLVSLPSRWLRKTIGGNNRYYINFLEQHRYLECPRTINGSKKYMVGKHAALYRIAPSVLKKSYVYVDLTNNYVIKKMKRQQTAYDQRVLQSTTLSATRKTLLQMASRAQFDYSSAWQAVQSNGNASSRKLTLKKDYIRYVQHTNFTYKPDPDYYGERLHHKWTNMYKDVRKHLYFQEPGDIVEFDIANSQFYFLSVVFNYHVREILPEYEEQLRIIETYCAKEDVVQFCTWAQQGVLYDELTGMYQTRAKAKAALFKIMFSDHVTFKSMKNKFARQFPNIREMIDQININCKRPDLKPTNSDAWKNLPAMMQRLESRVMIDRLATNFIAAGASDFITVHDSFLVQRNDLKLFLDTVKQVFAELEIGTPKLTDCDSM